MKRAIILALAGVLPAAASAQSFSDNFDVDSTANWKFNSSVTSDTATNNVNNEANFFFDYSTVGIPSAPRSIGGTTRGLKMEANVFSTTPGIFSGMSASPLGQHFNGDYTLTLDVWQNFQGPFPGGGSGTTQLTMAGIGSAETTAQFPGGTYNGRGFAATPDGGSATDYRAYTGPGAPLAETSGAYAAGNIAGVTNNTNAYYNVFQGSVPAAQTAIAVGLGFNNQTGSTAVGALGMAWHTWQINKIGDTVTWSVDGRLIATSSYGTPGGDNIFVGYFDSNATVSADAISRTFLFGLVDNVTVTPVPEPATMTALGLGALALLRRRNRK
jgi:hypothetical protein